MNRHKSLPLVLALLLATAIGCEQSSTPNAAAIFKPAGEHEVSKRIYRLDPPDEILITCPNVKELDGQRVIIDTNGMITLPLLGEIKVAGMTEGELKQTLTDMTAKFYVNPVLRVVVTDNSKYIYLFGLAGTQQGKFPYNGRVTVISALANAGFNVSAWPEQVRLSRPARDGNANATVVINFNKVWDYGDLTQNYLIEEGDILFIPMNPVARWSVEANQLLSPLVATAALVTFGPSVANATNGR